MNVSDLKRLIENLPDEMQVILAKDSEGNRFSPMCDYCIGYYFPSNTWSGDFTSRADYEEEEPGATGDCDAICLGPVN